MPLEKIRLRHHRHRVGMADHRAAVPPLDRGRVGHVIPVAVRQHQQVDLLPGKLLIRPLRRIEKDVALRRLDQKAVGGVVAAGKRFELKHKLRVEPKCLIFLAQSGSQGDL